MAIFKKKTAPAAPKVSKVKAPAKKEVNAAVVEVAEAVLPKTEKKNEKVGGLDLSMVIVRPHITEKASDLSEHNVYGFEINKRANKMHVKMAVEKLYKVTPMKVAVINGAPKFMKNPRTGRMQMKKQSIKKAFVYLKKGDKIEFV